MIIIPCVIAGANTARDEDGDGFHEIHVNTQEGFWSLLPFLVATPSRHLAGETAVVFGLFHLCITFDPGKRPAQPPLNVLVE